MSTLYLSADPRTLADRLADDLDRDAKNGDFFRPALIVVPNRYLKKWLRLWLARRLDVAINLQFDYLEDALWDLLRTVDPSPQTGRPEAVDEHTYRLMVLSVLLREGDRDLAPLRRYLQLQGASLSRLSCRRAWYLAERLAARIQDYEYNRQDVLIQRWLNDELGLTETSPVFQMLERAQRSVFQHITREPDGRRALLNRGGQQVFKTFPQYAMELMAQPAAACEDRRIVHFFGFTQVSELHARTIAWLGKALDVRFHHLNVLGPWCDGDLAAAAQLFREPPQADDGARELLKQWGRAGAESLWLTSRLMTDGGFALTAPVARETNGVAIASGPTVLERLRGQLLGRPASGPRIPQDTSLQIVGCPGIAREVETVYNSILHNLNRDATLRQTDIAVLVTDMPKYRAALQAVFERPPQRLQYNMVDFSAAGISTFGQAVLGMLDLAQESFARSRVFQVILNPCFLARLGVDRAQAMTWLEWAESLGIYQGWDAAEKEQQGYPRSPFFAWKLGLQRLRLGRFMELGDEGSDTPAPRFGHIIPFADLASTDREELDAFCRAVEGLLPTLARLRNVPMSGARWARDLERLVNAFLDVPAELPEEGQVRADLLAALSKLDAWDDLQDEGKRTAGLPLALVREFVQTQLEGMPGNRGEYLIGGVSIAALQPMRPVPFAIVYIVGLGEDLFPGSNALSSFDLRGAQRINGDVRPAEARLYDLLATVLSAQQKLYLLYNNHDLQRDQPILQSPPLQQLRRYLNQHVLRGDFAAMTMPMHDDDPRWLDSAAQPAYQDVLVQQRPADRCLAIMAGRQQKRVTLDAAQEAEWNQRWRELEADFSIVPQPAEPTSVPAQVSIAELRRFLALPAQAALRRHLRIEEDHEHAIEDDEPLVTTKQAADRLVRQTIQDLAHDAAHRDVATALASWRKRFTATYADARLRSSVPDDAFGEIDQNAILAELQERIHGQGQFEALLRAHADMTFCGPVLIGESLSPIGARLRFPALRLRPGDELPAEAMREIRVNGFTDLAWHAPGRFDVAIITTSERVDGREVHATMFEPVLLYLALLANTERNARGIASQKWLAERVFQIHVAHGEGVQTWSYPVGAITPTEAAHYLAELAQDFLDVGQFDLLPFEILRSKQDLRLAFHDDFTGPGSPTTYLVMLEAAIAEQREHGRGFRVPPLVDLIGAAAPADAWAKVRRRFRLLDRGPLAIRNQPRVRRPPRKTAAAVP